MRYQDLSKLYINLGIESAEIPEDPVTDTLVEDTTSAEAIEDADTVTDLNNDVDQLESFTEITEGAGELEMAVEAAIVSGKGLNRIEAAALNLALKSTMGKYINVEANLVPANESYEVSTNTNGSSEVNKEQTKQAKKGIGAGIKAFVQAIIKKIKSIIKGAGNFFHAIKTRLTGATSDLVKLTKILKATPGFQPQEIEFNVNNVYIDGKYDTKALVQGINDATEGLQYILSKEGRDSQEEAFLNAGIDAVKSAEGMDNWSKLRETVKGYAVTTFSKLSDGSLKTEQGQRRSVEYPGGRAFLLNQGSDSGPNQLAYVSFKRALPGPEQTKMKIMGPGTSELEDLIDAAFTMMNMMKNNVGGQHRQRTDYLNIIEKIDKKWDPKTEATIENNKDQLSSISNFIAANSRLGIAAFDYSIVLQGSIVQLVKATIEAATAKAESEKKEGEEAGGEKTA